MATAKTKVLGKHDNDVVIVAAVRTAMTKVPLLVAAACVVFTFFL